MRPATALVLSTQCSAYLSSSISRGRVAVANLKYRSPRCCITLCHGKIKICMLQEEYRWGHWTAPTVPQLMVPVGDFYSAVNFVFTRLRSRGVASAWDELISVVMRSLAVSRCWTQSLSRSRCSPEPRPSPRQSRSTTSVGGRPARRCLGAENGRVLGCAPGGPLVSRTRSVERVPSRLRSSSMMPRGARYAIMPPTLPHTRRNLHTPHA